MLTDENVDIQPHTKTHRNLIERQQRESFSAYINAIRSELSVPQRIISNKLGHKTTSLSYPFGATNSFVAALTEVEGYTTGFTVQRAGNPFFQNNFDYTDTRGIYSKTFDSNSGAKGGSLHLSMDKYIYKGALNLGYGGGFGLGYSTGKGIFTDDGTVSTTRFNLYSLPLDLRLLVELPIGQVLKLSLAGGPSAMGLVQNRSDRDDGDSDKERKQVGFGYFAEGKMKLNLSHIFTDTGFSYYRDHEVSFMSVDLAIRTQNYSGFADELEISGMSYGLGFTFEFL